MRGLKPPPPSERIPPPSGSSFCAACKAPAYLRSEFAGRFTASGLFSGDRCFDALGPRGPEVAPAVLCRRRKQGRRRVDREGVARDLKQGQVVDGVAEGRIGAVESHAAKRGGFAFVRSEEHTSELQS